MASDGFEPGFPGFRGIGEGAEAAGVRPLRGGNATARPTNGRARVPGQTGGDFADGPAEGDDGPTMAPMPLPEIDLSRLSDPTPDSAPSVVDHPLLRGLLMELPAKGTALPPGWLDRWFAATRSILELLYEQEPPRS